VRGGESSPQSETGRQVKDREFCGVDHRLGAECACATRLCLPLQLLPTPVAGGFPRLASLTLRECHVPSFAALGSCPVLSVLEHNHMSSVR
jgi:hypothetical protein